MSRQRVNKCVSVCLCVCVSACLRPGLLFVPVSVSVSVSMCLFCEGTLCKVCLKGNQTGTPDYQSLWLINKAVRSMRCDWDDQHIGETEGKEWLSEVRRWIPGFWLKAGKPLIAYHTGTWRPRNHWILKKHCFFVFLRAPWAPTIQDADDFLGFRAFFFEPLRMSRRWPGSSSSYRIGGPGSEELDPR